MAGCQRGGKPLAVGVPAAWYAVSLSCANAVKVNLYLLRRHQDAKCRRTTWRRGGRCTGKRRLPRIADAVGMKDRTVFRALDQSVDFGLARRERRRSKGVIIGSGLSAFAAPKELTDQAIQRLKNGLVNAELATEEAKRKLARDGIVFENDAERKAELYAMFRPNENGSKESNAMSEEALAEDAPPVGANNPEAVAKVDAAEQVENEQPATPNAVASNHTEKKTSNNPVAAPAHADDDEWESACPDHLEYKNDNGTCLHCGQLKPPPPKP